MDERMKNEEEEEEETGWCRHSELDHYPVIILGSI